MRACHKLDDFINNVFFFSASPFHRGIIVGQFSAIVVPNEIGPLFGPQFDIRIPRLFQH